MKLVNKQIRVLTLGVFIHDGKILVDVGYDQVKRKHFWRLPGGGVEFGERSEETLKREMKEELNAEIEVGKKLAMLENIFQYNGGTGHEIVVIYQANILTPEMFAKEEFAVLDSKVNGKIIWKSIADFERGDILYPEGSLALVK